MDMVVGKEIIGFSKVTQFEVCFTIFWTYFKNWVEIEKINNKLQRDVKKKTSKNLSNGKSSNMMNKIKIFLFY